MGEGYKNSLYLSSIRTQFLRQNESNPQADKATQARPSRLVGHETDCSIHARSYSNESKLEILFSNLNQSVVCVGSQVKVGQCQPHRHLLWCSRHHDYLGFDVSHRYEIQYRISFGGIFAILRLQ